MMTLKRTTYAVVAVAISLGLSAAPAALAAKKAGGAAKTSPAAGKASPSVSDEAAIRERVGSLASAASSGDAEKMSSLWAPDGTYVDEDGVRVSGRQAIQERFAAVRRGNSNVKVSVEPESVKMLGADAAWVEGTVSRQTSLGMEPSTRFTMLLQKNGGTWLISSATETPVADRGPEEHLAVLDWLIGQWKAERGDDKVTMTAEWAGKNAFIVCKYKVESSNGGSVQDNQVIGWDPTRQQIVSWHFDANGSFGYGSWSKRGKQWVIQAEGVEPSGSHTNATNIISPEDRDKFVWQSVGRTMDGVPVADVPPLVVQRAKN